MRLRLILLFLLIVSPILWAKDYYKILGVPRNASEQDIKKAYRSLAMKFHPDRKAAWQDTMTLEQAEARFKDINEANDVLKDPTKRAKYDRTYRPAAPQQTRTQPDASKAKKWEPQDFAKAKPRPTPRPTPPPPPRPSPQADPVADYLKRMNLEFSKVKNKTAETFADYVSRVSHSAKSKGLPKLKQALRKFMDGTVDVFFKSNPTIDDLNKVKAAYEDPNIQLNLDKRWLEGAPTRADYINRVKALQGDLSREDFLRKSGAILDTTAESLWGKGAGSAAVFREIDELENLEKMKAAYTQKPTPSDPYNKYGRQTSAESKPKPRVKTGAYNAPCNSGAAVRAMEAYINTKIGTSSSGRIIDIAI